MSECKKLLVVAVAVMDPDEPDAVWPYEMAQISIRDYVNSDRFSPETIKERLMDIPEGPGEVHLLVARVE